MSTLPDPRGLFRLRHTYITSDGRSVTYELRTPGRRSGTVDAVMRLVATQARVEVDGVQLAAGDEAALRNLTVVRFGGDVLNWRVESVQGTLEGVA